VAKPLKILGNYFIDPQSIEIAWVIGKVLEINQQNPECADC
jgi:hypothetical protein